MDLSFVTSLPPAAQLVFVGSLAAIYGLVHFGILSGRKAAGAPKAPGASEIVAITVDSRAIDKLTGEVAGLSIAMTEYAVAGKELASSNRELGQHIRGLTDELRETNTQLQITREVTKARP